VQEPHRIAFGRREQVALALLAGLGLLLVGRLALRGAPSEGPLLVVSPTPAELVVHVAGEVVIPGVYRLRPGARWSDALAAAHGPTFLADLAAVNLAQPLRDGERVFIPRTPDPVLAAGPENGDGEGPPAGQQRRNASPRSNRASAAAAAPVEINSATAADLEALPGIGPVLAARIVAHREEHGRFERLEDLLEVEGIGPRLLARLRPLVQVR
jgi:competence protein ComEA